MVTPIMVSRTPAPRFTDRTMRPTGLRGLSPAYLSTGIGSLIADILTRKQAQLRAGHSKPPGGQLQMLKRNPGFAGGDLEHVFQLLSEHAEAAHARVKIRIVQFSSPNLPNPIQHLLLSIRHMLRQPLFKQLLYRKWQSHRHIAGRDRPRLRRSLQ